MHCVIQGEYMNKKLYSILCISYEISWIGSFIPFFFPLADLFQRHFLFFFFFFFNLAMEPTAIYNQYRPPMLPAGWIEYRAPTGQPYWYNTITRQSTWSFPAQQQQQPPPPKKKQIK